jgi:hypothetical protein
VLWEIAALLEFFVSDSLGFVVPENPSPSESYREFPSPSAGEGRGVAMTRLVAAKIAESLR